MVLVGVVLFAAGCRRAPEGAPQQVDPTFALDIPTRFIGTGETAEDFAPFDAKKFVEEIF